MAFQVLCTIYFEITTTTTATTTTATTTEPIQTVSGDVNADGAVTLADLVMLQRYLLGVGELTDWTAGDLCADGCINGLDLALMRQRLTVID